MVLNCRLGSDAFPTKRCAISGIIIGVHSDVITDGILELSEAGVITGHRKTRHHGRIVAGYRLGMRRLYDFIDDNPHFLFLPIDRVCDPEEIAANPRMVSITQAFAIDLTGQVCTDQFNGQFYGGVSTQATFMRGAARSPAASRSSALRPPPRRAPRISFAGDGVGIARSDVHYVITEYGIAYLFGKSIRERAVALIEVAHPRHRDTLLETAKQLGYVPREQYLASQAAYPVQEERAVELKNGAKVRLRPARAADARALQALFHCLSSEDVYTRFFRALISLHTRRCRTFAT